ncbi:hypothetical protein HNO89_003048 [Sporosarcina luteola]|nr:hypothetical protein [Sporosarcina luteola]
MTPCCERTNRIIYMSAMAAKDGEARLSGTAITNEQTKMRAEER